MCDNESFDTPHRIKLIKDILIGNIDPMRFRSLSTSFATRSNHGQGGKPKQHDAPSQLAKALHWKKSERNRIFVLFCNGFSLGNTLSDPLSTNFSRVLWENSSLQFATHDSVLVKLYTTNIWVLGNRHAFVTCIIVNLHNFQWSMYDLFRTHMLVLISSKFWYWRSTYSMTCLQFLVNVELKHGINTQ